MNWEQFKTAVYNGITAELGELVPGSVISDIHDYFIKASTVDWTVRQLVATYKAAAGRA